MNTQKLLIALLTIVLTAGPLSAEDNAVKEFSETRFACVDLRIATDPKTFTMGITKEDTERLSDVMMSPKVLEAAAKDVLGVSDVYDKEQFLHLMFDIPCEIGGLQVIHVNVSVSLKDKHKPAAKEFLEAYIEKLKGSLEKEDEFGRTLYVKRFSTHTQQAEDAERELHCLLEEQNALDDQRGPLDKESVRQRLLEHRKAQIENEMQRAMLDVRSDGLSQQVAELNQSTQAAIHDDQVINISQEIVKSLEEQLQNKQELGKAGRASEEEINIVRERFLQAKLQLSEREQLLQLQASEEIRELNVQLRQTWIRQEELKTENDVLINTSPGSLSDSLKYEMLEIRIEAAKEKLKRAIIEKSDSELQCQLLQSPVVSYEEIVSSK